MKNKKRLKTNILKSNLSRQDKDFLIAALEEEDIDNFIKKLLQAFAISKEILELFGINIGDWDI